MCPRCGMADREYGWACHQMPGGQEPPLEKLAPGHAQALDVAPGAHDGHHPGSLLVDSHHPQAVPRAAARAARPEYQHRPCSCGPQRRPDRPGQRVADERHPVGQLVGKRQGQGQVRVQVDGPPGLVAHPAAGRPYGSEPRQHQQAERHGGGQHVGVLPDQDGELVPRPGPGLLGVADGDEDGMGGDQVDGPLPEEAVPPQQAVLTDGPLHDRYAGDRRTMTRSRKVPVSPATSPANVATPPGAGQRAARFGAHGQRHRAGQPERHHRGGPVDGPAPGAPPRNGGATTAVPYRVGPSWRSCSCSVTVPAERNRRVSWVQAVSAG